MYLSERINWILSSFPHGISKICLNLSSWDNVGRLGSRIRDGSFCVYLKFETRGVRRGLDATPDQNGHFSFQCLVATECGTRTPQQQQYGVGAILKNHESTERYTSMICALVKIWHCCIPLVKKKLCISLENYSVANAQKIVREEPECHLVEGKDYLNKDWPW